MIRIEELFTKYIGYFQTLKSKTEKELQKLPKGVLQKKKINVAVFAIPNKSK
ncbi:MAG: hypothetical protein KKD29_05510 [Candidatus Omnitrophica bacterium]|nr:hypothetical protein [Candidatus Omnitrophota bacterium]MBU4487697.1 hypothetical protein [Candidatus Omnitrophota bacterium]MCG2704824.1 hypothetical protein [Candidatus Omnitrophota bacterium]